MYEMFESACVDISSTLEQIQLFKRCVVWQRQHTDRQAGIKVVNRQAGKQVGTQVDRQAGRQAGRHTGTQIGRQTERKDMVTKNVDCLFKIQSG